MRHKPGSRELPRVHGAGPGGHGYHECAAGSTVAAERAGEADQDGRPSGAALPVVDLSVVRGVGSSTVVPGSVAYRPVIAGPKLRENATTILSRGRALQGVGLSSIRLRPHWRGPEDAGVAAEIDVGIGVWAPGRLPIWEIPAVDHTQGERQELRYPVEFAGVFENFITPTFEGVRFEVTRADDIENQGNILKVILNRIKAAITPTIVHAGDGGRGLPGWRGHKQGYQQEAGPAAFLRGELKFGIPPRTSFALAVAAAVSGPRPGPRFGGSPEPGSHRVVDTTDNEDVVDIADGYNSISKIVAKGAAQEDMTQSIERASMTLIELLANSLPLQRPRGPCPAACRTDRSIQFSACKSRQHYTEYLVLRW